MIKASIYCISLFGLLLTIGCSSDGDGPSTAPPATNGGENPEPEPVEKDSTTAMYRQFFFRGTHNSYSGNLGGMEREGLMTQLERGLRFFEFDLFSFYTKEELAMDWSENVDYLSSFTYEDEIYMISYNKADGEIKLFGLDNGDLTLRYDNLSNPWTTVDREFSVLTHSSDQYILDYIPSNGILTVHNFNGSSLSEVGFKNTGVLNARLSSFVYGGELYISLYSGDMGTYEIRKVAFVDDDIEVGATLYKVDSVPLGESFYPFEQGGELYIFRHNVNTVTNYKVETIEVTGNNWSLASIEMNNSELLKGNVTAVQSNNGKLYVNSYTANGNVIGSQLVVDGGMPILVNEYINETDVLLSASVELVPTQTGYGLFLKKGGSIQFSSIHIGELVLGHDAPGDEVDLSVDNPTSFKLADWVEYMARWSENHPYHEPLFIMTELKEYEHWLADAKWQTIIELMQNKFDDKLRYHSSNGFHNESIVDPEKIINGKTLYFMDENGSKEGGMLGKIVLYIQPNNKITKAEYTNDFQPFETSNGVLQENFLQLKRYREDNKLVSPDWRYPNKYGNDIGAYIDARDLSYISRIFHMQSSAGDGQYDKIRCSDVMFAVSDRPYEGRYVDYTEEQKVKNDLEKVVGCD